MIEVSAAVEDHALDALVLRPLGDEHTDGLSRRRVRALDAGVAVLRRSRSQRLAGGVVDDLGVDVLLTLENREARTLGRTAHLAANAFANPSSGFNSLFCAIHKVSSDEC